MDTNLQNINTVNVGLSALCFTANTAGSTVELCKVGSPSIANTAYSTDGNTWTNFTPSSTQGINVITLANVGDTVYFRNDITSDFSAVNYLQFKMSGSISASGNCNSMYSSTGFNDLTILTYMYCYKSMFFDCTSLTAAPALPAAILSEGCYRAMFQGCTSLAIAPELPAASLVYGCYQNMFAWCTSLITAPELPATALASYCYAAMFYNCSNLTATPVLPATTLANTCYSSMFQGCTSLTTPPVLPATTLKIECYQSMFKGCTSLIAVPVLLATTLTSYCYAAMFSGCTSLQISDSSTAIAVYAFRLPSSGTFTNTIAQANMFAGCAGTRSSNNMAGAAGNSYTYYTQNLPVSTPIRYVDVGGIQRKLRADNAINDDLGNNIAETYAKNTDPDIEILNNAIENKGIGYVTGKTYTPVFTNISVTCTKDYNNTYYGYSSDISGPFEINLPAYRITINSNTFVTTSINCDDSLDWYTVYLGNAYLISDSYPNTGESYCVASGIFSSGGSTTLCVALDSTWGSGESSIVANISVTEIHNIYSQIDRNCIPPEGNNATASGRYSHAEGFYTTASGEFSHAEGNSTTASGHASHAEGYYTTASGDYSHAEGQATEASGEFSHAEGYDTEANNENSHAEGNSTTASGYASHAEGFYAVASGHASHAEGHGTSALGEDSHAQNTRTIAQGNSQTVIGKYNIANTTSALIIGNGTNYNARSNALTIDWSGNIVCNNIPAPPNANGNYVLKCSVASGVVTYRWAAE